MPTFRIHTNAGVYNVDAKTAKAARVQFAKKMPHAFITKIKLTTCNNTVTNPLIADTPEEAAHHRLLYGESYEKIPNE